MIVEVQGMGFWTRVRLPSTPLICANPNSMGSDFVRFTPLVTIQHPIRKNVLSALSVCSYGYFAT